MASKTNCFLEINGFKNSFWVDEKCTPNRIKRCLYEYQAMSPEHTKLYLNGKELTEEIPVVQLGLKEGDTIKVETVKDIQTLLYLLNGTKKLCKKKYVSDECCVCFTKINPDDENIPLYVPCGHICVCSECYKNVTKCPICQP